MIPSQFEFILSFIEVDIEKKVYNRNIYPLSPEEKLAINSSNYRAGLTNKTKKTNV